MRILLLPGFMNSGALHWQTLWETTQPFAGATVQRVLHSSWDAPNYDVWKQELESYLDNESGGGPVVLVCHSLGCLNALSLPLNTNIVGALLVAPANPERTGFPKQIVGFPSPLRIETKPAYPTIMVISETDPYAAVDWAKQISEHLQCKKFINIGKYGHINADSQLGEWLEGQALVRELLVSSNE